MPSEFLECTVSRAFRVSVGVVDNAEKTDPAAADPSFTVSVRKSSFEVKHMIASPSLVVLSVITIQCSGSTVAWF